MADSGLKIEVNKDALRKEISTLNSLAEQYDRSKLLRSVPNTGDQPCKGKTSEELLKFNAAMDEALGSLGILIGAVRDFAENAIDGYLDADETAASYFEQFQQSMNGSNSGNQWIVGPGIDYSQVPGHGKNNASKNKSMDINVDPPILKRGPVSRPKDLS